MNAITIQVADPARWRLWTADDDAMLTEHWAAGVLSSKEIGALVGRSRDAVRRRAQAIGLPGRPPNWREGSRKKGVPRAAARASSSFSPDEVRVLAEILAITARGGDARLVAKMNARAVGKLRAKAAAMGLRLDAVKASRAEGGAAE